MLIHGHLTKRVQGCSRFKVRPPLFAGLEDVFFFGGLMTPSTRLQTEPFCREQNCIDEMLLPIPGTKKTPNPFQPPQEMTRIQENQLMNSYQCPKGILKWKIKTRHWYQRMPEIKTISCFAGKWAVIKTLTWHSIELNPGWLIVIPIFRLITIPI